MKLRGPCSPHEYKHVTEYSACDMLERSLYAIMAPS